MKFLSIAITALTPLLVLPSVSHAQLLGISFGATGDATDSSTGNPGIFGIVSPSLDAGVIPQLNFNNEDGGSADATGYASVTDQTNLVYSDGSAATGLSLSFTASGTYYAYSGNDNNQQLLGSFLDNSGEGVGGSNTTLTLTGLSDGTHTLVLYISGGQTGVRGGTYTVNGVSYVLGNNGNTSSDSSSVPSNFAEASPGVFTPAPSGSDPDANGTFVGVAGNYFETTFTGSTLTLTTSDDFGTDGLARAPLDGIQIETDAPEPTTEAMLGLGLVGLLMLINRRRLVGASPWQHFHQNTKISNQPLS